MPDIIDVLLSGDQGIIYACNLIDCIEQALLDRSVVKDVLDEARTKPLPGNERQAVNCITEVVWDRRLYFSCLATPASVYSSVRKFATVLKRVDLVRILDATRLTKSFIYVNRHGPGSGRHLDTTFGELASLSGDPDALRLGSTIGAPTSVVWWSDREDVRDRIGLRPTRQADQMRSLLGLVHHGHGVSLMSIRISSNFLKPTLTRPTCLDGRGHRRFRALPDTSSPADEGYTVDLNRFCDGQRNIDGVREYVSEAVQTDGVPLTWSPVGICSTEAETGSAVDRDREFARRLLRGRSLPDVEAALRSIMA